MIYTVTLNPALDRFIVFEQVLTEDTTRIFSEKAYAAGKKRMLSSALTKSGLELRIVIEKAIKDHVITNSEYEEIVRVVYGY